MLSLSLSLSLWLLFWLERNPTSTLSNSDQCWHPCLWTSFVCSLRLSKKSIIIVIFNVYSLLIDLFQCFPLILIRDNSEDGRHFIVYLLMHVARIQRERVRFCNNSQSWFRPFPSKIHQTFNNIFLKILLLCLF